MDQNRNQNPNRDKAEGERHEPPGRTKGGQSGQQFSPGQSGNRDTPASPAHHDDAQSDQGQTKHTQERGRKSQSERNSSSGTGISNRGMDRQEEQEELPPRGSERDVDQSER